MAGENEVFIYVKLRPRSFAKYIKCRNDIDRPGWFKCSNNLLEDDELNDFSAPEMCAWVHIMSQASHQQSAAIRINLLKTDALKRKFTREDLSSAIGKLKALGILKSDVTSTLRARNVHVTQRGEDGSGEEKRKEEVEREEKKPAAAFFPFEGKYKSVKDLIAAIPLVTKDALVGEYREYGGTTFIEAAAANAFAYHSSRPESLVWDIHQWISKIIAAAVHAKGKAPVPFRASNPEPRPRAAPDQIEIIPVSAKEALSNASKSPIAELVAGLSIVKQMEVS